MKRRIILVALVLVLALTGACASTQGLKRGTTSYDFSSPNMEPIEQPAQ